LDLINAIIKVNVEGTILITKQDECIFYDFVPINVRGICFYLTCMF